MRYQRRIFWYYYFAKVFVSINRKYRKPVVVIQYRAMESARQSSLVHMSSATVWVAPILRIEKSRVSWYSKISWLYQLCTTFTLGTVWIRTGTNNLPKKGHVESRCPRLSLVCSSTVERLSEIQGVASSTLAKPIYLSYYFLSFSSP